MSAPEASAGEAFAELIAVMDRLRRECAWTSTQTHQTLGRYLLEETHETLEAIDTGASENLRDELGDLLLQVIFNARIAQDGEGWNVEDVVRGLTDKLIRRNPHVFGDGEAQTVEEIDAAWQQAKAAEKSVPDSVPGAVPDSVHDQIPATLPALAYADKVLKRLDDPAVEGSDVASRLLALVAEARSQGIDPEAALRQRVRELG